MQAGREIKFRMWDFENQEMIDGNSLAFEEYAPISHLLSRKGIMQYTGFHDKHGREIYEGDIVRLEDCGDIFDHVVKWIPEEARFVFETTEDWYGPEEMDFDFCEVIGNVYENWDLVPG